MAVIPSSHTPLCSLDTIICSGSETKQKQHSNVQKMNITFGNRQPIPISLIRDSEPEVGIYFVFFVAQTVTNCFR